MLWTGTDKEVPIRMAKEDKLDVRENGITKEKSGLTSRYKLLDTVLYYGTSF
jgi:hypothetical protein